VGRFPAKQRIVLGCPGGGPRVEIAQAENQRKKKSRHHGEHCEDRLPDPPQHDSPSSLGRVLDQHEEEPSEGPSKKKSRTTRSHEKKNCFGFAAPRIAQAAAPSRAQTAPMTGMRFHGCPGGIVTCSGRSATRSRSEIIQDSRTSTLRAPRDSSR